MSGELFYSRSETLIAVVLFAFLLLFAEVGFGLGRSRSTQFHEAVKSQVGTIQGAILGILGLLLGFSFAMAVSRFDMRKQLVIEEANAIGTAAMRARLLPAPRRDEAAALFRSYAVPIADSLLLSWLIDVHSGKIGYIGGVTGGFVHEQ